MNILLALDLSDATEIIVGHAEKIAAALSACPTLVVPTRPHLIGKQPTP